jgi:molecular chaperone IbpA
MRLRDTKGQALRADRSHVAQTKEVMLCVHLILLPSIVRPLASTGCSPCSTRSAAWKGRCRAIRPTISRGQANDYRISVAVAGFTDADLSIETKENRLTIRGEKQTNDEEKTGDVLYQGIAARSFERSFELADYVKVKGASLQNGLLHVNLVREIPEAMKPRAIPITSSSKLLEVKPTKVAA